MQNTKSERRIVVPLRRETICRAPHRTLCDRIPTRCFENRRDVLVFPTAKPPRNSEGICQRCIRLPVDPFLLNALLARVICSNKAFSMAAVLHPDKCLHAVFTKCATCKTPLMEQVIKRRKPKMIHSRFRFEHGNCCLKTFQARYVLRFSDGHDTACHFKCRWIFRNGAARSRYGGL